jgi:hypothetical protein
MYGGMTLVHLRLLRPHRTVADRVLVPDAVSDGVPLLHVLSDELAVDKTSHQDGDIAKRLFGSRICLDNKYFI